MGLPSAAAKQHASAISMWRTLGTWHTKTVLPTHLTDLSLINGGDEREKSKLLERGERSVNDQYELCFFMEKDCSFSQNSREERKVFHKKCDPRPLNHDWWASKYFPQPYHPYLGHGMRNAVALHRFLKLREWDKDIVVVGCDGTWMLEVPKAALHISRNFFGVPWSGMCVFFMVMNFSSVLCLLCMMVKHQDLFYFRDPSERSCKVISPWENQSNLPR